MKTHIHDRARLLNKEKATEEAFMTSELHFFGQTRNTVRRGLLAAAFILIPAFGARAELTSAKFEITAQNIQESPAYFKFQARVSQGKIPLGDVKFEKVFVFINDGASDVCQETFPDLDVIDGVLNLEIGRGIGGTCHMSTLVSTYKDLQFRVCLNSTDNCLKPISFASVPYAVKATYAVKANEAAQANEAVQCHYAHRVTADRDMFETQAVGKGYFDFYTPTDVYFANQTNLKDMFWYEQTAQSIPNSNYKKGGYIQWAGMSPDGNNLHICATADSDINDAPIPLDELVLHADFSRFAGQLIVEGPQNGIDRGAKIKQGMEVSGVTQFFGDADAQVEDQHVVVGYVKDQYRMIIWDKLDVRGTADFFEEARFAKKVTLGTSRGFVQNPDAPPVFEVYGNAKFYGTVNLATNAKLTIPVGSVGTSEIADKSIKNDDLGEKCVTGFNIEDGSITEADLSKVAASEAVTTSTIRGKAVTNAKIADAAVDTKQLARHCVHSENIEDEAVDSYHIKSKSITYDQIAYKTVDNSNLASDCVTSDKISNGSITGDDLASYTIKANNIGLGSVSSSHLSLSVTTHSFTSSDCGFLCAKNIGSTITTKACFLTMVPVGKGCGVEINADTKQWRMIGNDMGCKSMCF
ncbi:MAG: hypothetical protein MUC50_04090 [Myxococcota bacterium]|jgi:hypothetical protein|nr:hypothetical protein [Myxococcota bacterium]